MAVAVAVAVGCGSDDSDQTADSSADTTATTRTYVGTVEGTGAFVGVVDDGTRALAYICDGVPADPEGTAPTVQAWFNGVSGGGAVDVAQPAGRLQLRLTDTGLTGTFTLPDGRAAAVTGRAVTGDAGLYRAESTGPDSKAVAGWILDADGEQRGGVGSSGATTKVSGARVLNVSQLTFSPQGLAQAKIEKVGITPIPIP